MLRNIQFQLLSLFLKAKISFTNYGSTNKQEDQLNVINLIFDKFSLNDLLKKFLNFLVMKRRFFYVDKILKDFVMICSKNRGEIQQN